jgi:hypothetical protein
MSHRRCAANSVPVPVATPAPEPLTISGTQPRSRSIIHRGSLCPQFFDNPHEQAATAELPPQTNEANWVRRAISPNEANTSSEVLSAENLAAPERVDFPRTKPIGSVGPFPQTKPIPVRMCCVPKTSPLQGRRVSPNEANWVGGAAYPHPVTSYTAKTSTFDVGGRSLDAGIRCPARASRVGRP